MSPHLPAAFRSLVAGAILATFSSVDADTVGRAIRVTDPLGHEIRTWYDRGGLPRFVKDARQFVTENRYDALGRLVETIAPTQRTPSDPGPSADWEPMYEKGNS